VAICERYFWCEIKQSLENPEGQSHTRPLDFVSDRLKFILLRFRQWCQINDIEIKYTQLGLPTQNSYIEWFNGSYRRVVLDVYLLEDVRNITEK